jgi:hypothetical protein
VFGGLNGDVRSGRFAFEVRALPNYGFEVVREICEVWRNDGVRHWFDRRTSFETNASGLRPSLDPPALCLPVVGGDDRFAPVLRAMSNMRVYSIEPGRLREMQDPDSGTALRRDGSNAASVLQELARADPRTMERLGQVLESIVPNTKAVRSTKHGNKLSLEFTQQWGEKQKLSFEAYNMSDGTLRALGLLMAVFQHSPPSVLVVEEPEATIHPGALGAVLDVLRHGSRSMQVVVTTHSPELLDAKWIEDRHIRVVAWNEGSSYVTPPAVASREALKTHLMAAGELLRANALQPDDALFAESQDLAQERLFGDLQ